jgi:hypothetical protein
VLEVFMLEIGQVDDLLGLLRDGAHVHLLQAPLVHHDHAAEAFRQRLQLKVSSPFPVLTHRLQVVLKGAVLILVQERPEKLLVPPHKGAGLITHEDMRRLTPVDLISEGAEEAIAVAIHILEGESEGRDLLPEGFEVLAIVLGELEDIPLGHLLAHLHLHLLVLLTLLTGLLDHPLPVLLLAHNSFIIYSPNQSLPDHYNHPIIDKDTQLS